MAEELKPQTGTPAAEQPSSPAVDPKPSTAAEGGSDDDLPAFVKDPKLAYEEIKKLRLEAKNNRTEARDFQKRLEALEGEKKTKSEQELAEQNKWKELADQREKELADMRAQFAKQQLENLRIQIGSEFKLTPALIKRLQGSTEEELRADAETLVKELGLNKPTEPAPAPAPETPQPPQPNTQARRQTTTVVPDGKPQGETDTERMKRLSGRGYQESPLFRSSNP